MDDLARRYAKHGVVVLAINVEGNQDTYKDFVQSKGYRHLQWARDASGEIATIYGVRGVPTTYFLGTDGTIRYVHVGYGSRMKEMFDQEIEVLLE